MKQAIALEDHRYFRLLAKSLHKQINGLCEVSSLVNDRQQQIRIDNVERNGNEGSVPCRLVDTLPGSRNHSRTFVS